MTGAVTALQAGEHGGLRLPDLARRPTRLQRTVRRRQEPLQPKQFTVNLSLLNFVIRVPFLSGSVAFLNIFFSFRNLSFDNA